MGTPFTPPDTIHREIRELAAVGLTPMEAIQAATWNAARAMKLDHDLGTVQVGRRADLVVLDADPLQDLDATQAVRLVMKDGEFVTPVER
jgi:imidazolonepropionase-like amidohydrolase